MLFAGSECGNPCGRGGCVTERYRNIAQPALVAEPPDGTAAGLLLKIRFAPGKKLGQLRMIQSMPDRKILLRRGAHELVPGTDQLAVIATVDAIADRAAKFFGNTAGQLNRQIGDAAPRIETIGRDEGAGGAGGDG